MPGIFKGAWQAGERLASERKKKKNESRFIKKQNKINYK